MAENMEIYSIKVSLRKCGVATNAIIRRQPIIFPTVRVKYRNIGEAGYNGISKTYDLKDAGLTEKNWAGSCCGATYFIICNTWAYVLYDKGGTFIKSFPISEVGEIVSATSSFFVTRSSDGIERIWCGDGTLKEKHELSAGQISELKKCKILRKGEFNNS